VHAKSSLFLEEDVPCAGLRYWRWLPPDFPERPPFAGSVSNRSPLVNGTPNFFQPPLTQVPKSSNARALCTYSSGRGRAGWPEYRRLLARLCCGKEDQYQQLCMSLGTRTTRRLSLRPTIASELWQISNNGKAMVTVGIRWNGTSATPADFRLLIDTLRVATTTLLYSPRPVRYRPEHSRIPPIILFGRS
jgi:hypothetical protein